MNVESINIEVISKPIFVESTNSYQFYAMLEKGSKVFVQLYGEFQHLKPKDLLTINDYIVDMASYYGQKRKIPSIMAMEASYKKVKSPYSRNSILSAYLASKNVA